MSDEQLDIYGHIPDDAPKHENLFPVNHYTPTLIRMDQFFSLLPKCGFNIRKTCREMDITPSAYYRWLKSDPEFAERIQAYRQEAFTEAFDFVRLGIIGDLDLDTRDRLYAALQLLKLEKMSSVNVSTNSLGQITGFDVKFSYNNEG